MQIFEQQNAVKMHFSIIPYGITMSMFTCLLLCLRLGRLSYLFILFFALHFLHFLHFLNMGYGIFVLRPLCPSLGPFLTILIYIKKRDMRFLSCQAK